MDHVTQWDAFNNYNSVLELFYQSLLVHGEMLILVVCGIAKRMLAFSYLLTVKKPIKRFSDIQIIFLLLKFGEL